MALYKQHALRNRMMLTKEDPSAPNSWDKIGRVWLYLFPLRDRRMQMHYPWPQGVGGKNKHYFVGVMRYHPEVSPHMRLERGKQCFSIQHIVDIRQTHRFLELLLEDLSWK